MYFSHETENSGLVGKTPGSVVEVIRLLFIVSAHRHNLRESLIG